MSKITRILLIGFAATMFVFCLCYIYLVQSRVVGVEFNPQTWQFRHFEFYADPFTNKQLIGIDRSGKVKWVIDPGITAKLGSNLAMPERWDLVEMDDYESGINEGPAAILADALTARKSGWSSTSVEFWGNWTSSNPTEAAVFWKAVQSLTIHGAYNDIPDLLDIAVSSTSEIPRLSDKLVGEALLRRAKQLQTEGEAAAAKAAAADGLKYLPGSSELQRIIGGK